MNRKMEYEQLKKELDMAAPDMEYVFKRAKRRVRRRKWIQKPFIGITVVFACFVLLVNFCVPAAYACSLIPGLKELAEAVNFSKSLQKAVENEYIQPVNLLLEDRGVTLKVEYLIVDQKQVNVFFRLNSEQYSCLSVNPQVESEEECIYGCNNWEVPNGKLQSMTVDFIEADVPSEMKLFLEVVNVKDWQMEAVQVDREAVPEEKESVVAEFEFLLEFDPEFTAAGQSFPLNQAVEIDGQKIYLTEMEIYPTHLRVNVETEEENTAWLKRLDFYIETDWGMKFNPVANGITATGSADSPEMVSYRADSTYFCQAKHLCIVITGAKWLDKDMERIYLNLATGTADQMPEGTQIDSIECIDNGWIIMAGAKTGTKKELFPIFAGNYYDREGREYWRKTWETRWEDRENGYFLESFPLYLYPDSEVWLTPAYSREWRAEEKIEIKIW